MPNQRSNAHHDRNLNVAVGQFKSAITTERASKETAIALWETVQRLYEQKQTVLGDEALRDKTLVPSPAAFQRWIVAEVGLDDQQWDNCLQLLYHDSYHALGDRHRPLVNKLVKVFRVAGYWSIFFEFGSRIVDGSREALEYAVRAHKRDPTLTLPSYVSILNTARQQRAISSRRGLKRDLTNFILGDFTQADKTLAQSSTQPLSNRQPNCNNKVADIQRQPEPLIPQPSKPASSNHESTNDNIGGSIKEDSEEDTGGDIGGDSGDDFQSEANFEENIQAETEVHIEEALERLSLPKSLPDIEQARSTARKAPDFEPSSPVSIPRSEPHSPSHINLEDDTLGFDKNNQHADEGWMTDGAYTESETDLVSRRNSRSISPQANLIGSRLQQHDADDSFVFMKSHQSSSSSIIQGGISGEMEEVNSQWRRALGTNQSIVYSGLPLSHKDIITLDDSAQLNDEIINSMLRYLYNDAGSRDDILLLNTFFLETLKRDGGLARCQRWTGKIDMSKIQYIIVPVHKPVHWALAIISISNASIITIDSLDRIGNPENKSTFSQLSVYFQSILNESGSSATIRWKHAVNFGMQTNGFDCGIYLLMAAEMFLKGPAAFIALICDAHGSSNKEVFDSLSGRRRFQDVVMSLAKHHRNCASNDDPPMPSFQRLSVKQAASEFGVPGAEIVAVSATELVIDPWQWKLLSLAKPGTDISPLLDVKYEGEVAERTGSSRFECRDHQDDEWAKYRLDLENQYQQVSEKSESANTIFDLFETLLDTMDIQFSVEREAKAAHEESLSEVYQKLLVSQRATKLLKLALSRMVNDIKERLRQYDLRDEAEEERITMRKKRRLK